MKLLSTYLRGKSLTVCFAFPEDYDMANIEALNVSIGSKQFTGDDIDISGQVVCVRLKSEDTYKLTGDYPIIISIDDKTRGVIPIDVGDVRFVTHRNSLNNASTNEQNDIVIALSITQTTINVDSVLYDVVAGKAATIEVGTVTTLEAGEDATIENAGTENEAVFNFGIPKGDKGDKGDAGYTPYIGVNGNWFINGVDTGVQAEGDATEAWVAQNYLSKLDVVGGLGNSETKVINQKTHLDNIAFPFYNAGFGHTDTANQLKMLSAIKSIRLIGNWDKSKNFAIRSLYRNHATYKYMITLYELSSAGAVVGATYYSSGEIEVTESGEGKHTVVSCPTDANGMSIEVIVDYNVLTENTTDYNFAITPYNWLIKKVNYDKTNIYDSDLTNLKISPAFVDAGFGFTNTDNQILIHSAIKDIRLIGSWDEDTNYQIRTIYRNHATEKYALHIQAVNDAGVVTSTSYVSGAIDVTEAGAGKYTRVLFPVVDGKSVELVIDYNVFATSTYTFYIGSLNYLIRPDKIDKSDTYEADIQSLKFQGAFYNAGFGHTDTDNVVLLNTAIKEIALIGDFSKSTRYAIRFMSRNHATSKYSIYICSVNNAGKEVVVYNSGAIDVTENTGGQTIVTFPVVSNRQVIATIDYNILTNGTEYNLFGVGKNWMIKPENINPATYNKYLLDTAGVFYDAGFGFENTDAQILVHGAIKDIRLIGNWDITKNYAIRNLYKNHATNKYRLSLNEVNSSGVVSGMVYDSGAIDVTEAGVGKYTRVTFPAVNGKFVEMTIDYNVLTSSLYGFFAGNLNFVIREWCVQNIQNIALTPVNGALQTFDYAGYLSTKTTPGSQALRKRNNAAFMNVINKRGGFYYRCDDNGADLVFESIFEKYGYAITYSINAALSEASRFVDVQRRGHLICDHTPDHSCNYFTIPTGSDALFTALIGSGIASISGGKATLQITVLDGVTDVTNPVTPATDLAGLKIGADGGYNLISGTNRIEGDFSAFTASPYFYVYVDNATGDKIGWVPVTESSVLAGSCTVTKQDGTAILFEANESINMYAQRTGSDKITLSEDAAYCIMLAGIEWFRVLGLQKPYAFCQPGGTTPRMNASAATGAIERLGLDAAFFSDSAVETVLTYNHTRNYPKLSYYPITLYVDYMTLADLQGVKELLSYYAATRKIVAVMSHHYLAKLYFEGATEAARIENYRKFIYDLMTWAYEQNIPVLSHSETVELLNNSTTNRSENIMPNLYTDRAGQGKPDGYDLGAGVVWVDDDGMHEDKIHSLKLNGNGELFTITDLGGLEKGINDFEIWIKGTTGGIVSVQFGALGTAIFTLTTTGAWQKFKLSDSTGITELDIPYTTNFLTITATASNNAGTDISVSGIKLRGI